MRYACGVEVGDNFIVTGGKISSGGQSNTVNTVALYSKFGFVRWLAPMIQPRRSHACTKFVTDTGETVRENVEISEV